MTLAATHPERTTAAPGAVVALVAALALPTLGCAQKDTRPAPLPASSATSSATAGASSAAAAASSPVYDPDAARADFASIPHVAEHELSEVQQELGGVLFSTEYASGEAFLLTGPRTVRRFPHVFRHGHFIAMTADAVEVLQVQSDRADTAEHTVVGADGRAVWSSPDWLTARIDGDRLTVLQRRPQPARITLKKTATGYVETARHAYPVPDKLSREMYRGFEMASLQSLHHRGEDPRIVRTTWAGHPDKPDHPLTPLAPRLADFGNERLCRAGKTTALVVRADDDGWIFFHDGTTWSRGHRFDLQALLAADNGTFGCEEGALWVAGQRLGNGHHLRCTPGGCRTTEIEALPERTDDGEMSETKLSSRAALGDKLLEVRVVPSNGDAGASIRYRFGVPGRLPAKAKVLVSDAAAGALRFSAIRLFGAANGAVLRIVDRTEKPGTALVFFDKQGVPTVPGVGP